MDKKIISCLLCALIAIFVIPSVILAASFDCGKAVSKIEKLICSDDELSKLDESLNEVYLRALNRADIKQRTIESQRQWVLHERNICQGVECLKHAYEIRIKELSLSSSLGTENVSKTKKCWVQTKSSKDFYVRDPGLCTAFEEMLNATCEPPEKLQCNWMLPQKKTEFTKIHWQPIDYRNYWPLIKDLRLSGWAKQYREDNWKSIEPMVRKQFERGYISLEAATVDIDRDGKEEYIVRSTYAPNCDPMGTIGVVNRQTNRLDDNYDHMKPGFTTGYEIILHKGKPYIFAVSWLDDDENAGIWEVFHGGNSNICMFRYLMGRQLNPSHVGAVKKGYIKKLDQLFKKKQRKIVSINKTMIGDLNNDGKDDAAFVFYGENAAYEWITHLAVFIQTNGKLQFADAIDLELSNVSLASIESDKVILQGLAYAKDDLKYSPTEPYKKSFILSNNKIIEDTRSSPSLTPTPSISNNQLLFQAVENSDIRQIRSFVSKGANVNATIGTLNPLFVAVRTNRLTSVKLLLELGADPNLGSPLFLAVRRDTEIVRVLISAGADVNAETKPYKYTPLGNAVYNSDLEFEKLKKELGYKGPLPNSLETIRLLVRAGAHIDHIDGFGESPLRTAVRLNNVPMISLLLELGADAHQYRDDSDSTGEQEGNSILMVALTWYSLFKNTEPIKLLLKHGANPNDKNTLVYDEECDETTSGKCTWRGYTVLTYAAKEGYLEVVKLLLEYGADPFLKRQDGKTAYELAQKKKHFKTAKLIQENMAAKGVPN